MLDCLTSLRKDNTGYDLKQVQSESAAHLRDQLTSRAWEGMGGQSDPSQLHTGYDLKQACS